jgi:hypothetical protein
MLHIICTSSTRHPYHVSQTLTVAMPAALPGLPRPPLLHPSISIPAAAHPTCCLQFRGRHYAVIGLERQGGFMLYDVTSPTAPK